MTEPEQKLMVPDARQERSSRVVASIGDVQNPMQLLAIAVQRGDSMERLQQLMDLKDRWEKGEAAKAYTQAIVEFKANPPKIFKTKLVDFTSERTGKQTKYKHATLGGVCEAIIEGLSKVGISHKWLTEQPDKSTVKVTCILTHRLGHSESVTLMSAPDDSGGKNSIQAIVSAVSYLERHTLLSATGLATFDQDDDGRGSEDMPRISEKQCADLIALYTELGGTKELLPKLLKHLKVEKLADILAKNYDAVVREIRALAQARADARARK